MKNKLHLFILVLLVFAVKFNFAQNTKNTKPPLTLYTTESGSFIFDTIINFTGVSKQDLYKRAKNWVISTIRTSDNTVVFDDKDSSEIRTDATILLTGYGYVNFKMSIYLKDNKSKIVYESFIYYNLYGYQYSFKDFPTLQGKKNIYKEFDSQFTLFRESLLKSLNNGGSNSGW